VGERPRTGDSRQPARSTRSDAIVAALLDAPATADELVRRLGRAPEELAADLVQLELEGRVARDADGRVRLVG
jgi:predicted Rossmann fold nucleotide-binding protein DprA/Smf involved in DNA uptake